MAGTVGIGVRAQRESGDWLVCTLLFLFLSVLDSFSPLISLVFLSLCFRMPVLDGLEKISGLFELCGKIHVSRAFCSFLIIFSL